ncbi:MAG: FHA domain-containing protein, partial [Anaerolineales bacterium]
MSPEFVLLALRLALALVLYAFLAATLTFLWRDLRSAALETDVPPQGYLELLSQPEPGLIFPLSNFNLFGRAGDNTIVLDDETVSGHHAQLSYRGGQWLLEDLGSKNGTGVNELNLEDPMVVTFGDEIRLGNVHLALKAGQPAVG